MMSVKEQLINQIDRLTEEQQQDLLNYALRLQQSTLPPGTPGEVLLELAERLDFDPDDLAEMMRVIDEDCERIDWDGWQ